MKAALIGLGMVSRTYGDAFRNSETVSLSTVFARSQESRTAFLDAWPELGARDAGSVEEIAAAQRNWRELNTGKDAMKLTSASAVERKRLLLMSAPGTAILLPV